MPLQYNYLDRELPEYQATCQQIVRNGVIGFSASAASSIASNWVRVIKTTKQTFPHAVTYPQVVNKIVRSEGLLGLLSRGLGTRILTSGVQGILFTVLWKLGQELHNQDTAAKV